MNRETMRGNGCESRAKEKEQWGTLTNDRLELIASKRDQLEREIQQAHRIIKDLSAKHFPL